jgi:D-alanyl-D-alanine carboxypeptidase
MVRIIDDPQYHWTRTEQLQGCMYWGRPVGKPGERFSYSDTGYILLGEVLETVTGKPLGVALRELIPYEDIGLDETWFEVTEQPPSDVLPRAHQYLDTVDTYEFDPSLDLYGGGGIVMTMKDLTELYTALFAGQVYRKKSTLEMMLAPVPKQYKEIDELDYRMGIFLQQVNGLDAYTHSGFWGVQVWYLPVLDVAIAITVTRQDDRSVVRTVLERIVARMQK